MIPKMKTRGEHIHEALLEVHAEIERAIKKHGVDRTPLNMYQAEAESFIILAEEVGEVARALTHDEGDPENLESELIQVAAMAVAFYVGAKKRRLYGA
jgi:NTP pyrophosphatase (non-canonical NTP hydrolase)